MTRRGQRQANDWRRLAFVGVLSLCALALWFVAPLVERALLVRDFDFSELEHPGGFRQIGSGDFSVASAPLAGLSGASDATGGEAADLHVRELCLALFGAEPAAGVVPIAYFSDYRCPYCRVLSEHLAALDEEDPRVRVAWHEWPVFGEGSELAARAALSAKRQGAYAAFHQRLMRTSFVPTPAYLRNVSERTGLDTDRLLADMQGVEVDRELAESRALAAAFGFPGTPGLIVGRTVVVGAIGAAELRALVERELADGPIEACR